MPSSEPQTASDALHAEVRSLIRLGHASVRDVDELALKIARFQARHVDGFRRLIGARGVDLEAARSADQIPAVPTDAFALARIAAFGPKDDRRVFRTSGTTRGGLPRGEHAFRTLETYELAASTWGRRCLWPASRAVCIALTPPDAPDRDSSLSFMVDRFMELLGGEGSHHLDAERGLNSDSAAEACHYARAAGRPALVLATSFALVHLLDAEQDRSRCGLPSGSRVMFTGGFKGRAREVESSVLRRQVASLFELPPAQVIGEYGMTELSSQLYESTESASGTLERSGVEHPVYLAPPWVRVTAVDPRSLIAVPEGEVGLARILDLANVDSAVAIQTADQVRITAHGVELLGRAPGAPPRGCSLAVDDICQRGRS